MAAKYRSFRGVFVSCGIPFKSRYQYLFPSVVFPAQYEELHSCPPKVKELVIAISGLQRTSSTPIKAFSLPPMCSSKSSSDLVGLFDSHESGSF